MSRRNLILFVLLVFLPLTSTSAAKGGVSLVDYGWGTQQNAIIVHSGDGVVPLTLVFKVSAEENHTLRPLEARLDIPPPIKNPNGGQVERLIPSVQLSKNQFKDGDGLALTFSVNVPTRTPPGWYDFKVNLSYEIIDEDGKVVGKGSNEFTFSLEVKGRSSVDLTLTGKVIKGESSTLYLVLRNIGKEDVHVTSIQMSASLIRILNPSVSGGSLLTPGSSVRYDFGAFADKALNQDYDNIAVLVHYTSGGDEYTVSKVFSVPLASRNEEGGEASPSLVVTSAKHMLYAGIPNEVLLTVKNVGDEVARKVKLQLSSQTVTVLGPTLFDLGDMDPGSSKEIGLKLLPSEDTKSYRLSISFSYMEKEDDEDITKQLSTEVGFGRIEEARIVISSLEASYSGGKLRVRGNLANVGNRRADNINATIESGVCVGTSTYLGELGNGESTGFSLSCPVAEGELPSKVSVLVKYLASPENWEETRREVAIEGPQSIEQKPTETKAGIMDQKYAVIWAIAGLIVGLIAGKVMFGRRSEEVEAP